MFLACLVRGGVSGLSSARQCSWLGLSCYLESVFLTCPLKSSIHALSSERQCS